MKRMIILLIIAIPLASIAMGAIALYIAVSEPDVAVRSPEPQLNKTSWQRGESPRPTP